MFIYVERFDVDFEREVAKKQAVTQTTLHGFAVQACWRFAV
jgi:hypothetical protein